MLPVGAEQEELNDESGTKTRWLDVFWSELRPSAVSGNWQQRQNGAAEMKMMKMEMWQREPSEVHNLIN